MITHQLIWHHILYVYQDLTCLSVHYEYGIMQSVDAGSIDRASHKYSTRKRGEMPANGAAMYTELL
jgi:hypothetical protein